MVSHWKDDKIQASRDVFFLANKLRQTDVCAQKNEATATAELLVLGAPPSS